MISTKHKHTLTDSYMVLRLSGEEMESYKYISINNPLSKAWINFEEILKSTCSLKWYITSTYNIFSYKTVYHIEAH